MSYLRPWRTSFNWKSIAGHREQLERFGSAISALKNDRPATKLMSRRPDIVGKAGELIYAQYAKREINLSVYENENDGGKDFPGVDVKAVRFMGYNIEYFLKVSPKLEIRAQWLILAVADLDRWRAALLGRIWHEDFLMKARLREFNEMVGPQLMVSEDDLQPLY